MADFDEPAKAQTTPPVIDPSLDPEAFRDLCHADPSIPVRIVYTNRSFRYPIAYSFHSR